MPKIKPFKALQYSAGKAWETLCCPPYDVVSEKQQRELEARNAYNAIRLERPADGYQKAAERLAEWRAEGVLAQSAEPAYYMLEMDFTSGGKNYVLRGFTALMELTPFGEGQVLPHEETLSKAKEDRLALMRATNCNFSPICGLYDDQTGEARAALDAAAKLPPDAEFTMPDGVTHRFWSIKDIALQESLTRVVGGGPVFIADGHHRYETSLNYCGRGGFIMITLVEMSDPGLVVLPTHRVVKGKVPENLIENLKGVFRVEDADAMSEPPNGSLVFYHNGKAKLLTLTSPNAMDKLNASAAYKSLDVAILHSLILEPYFGIDKDAMAAQSRLTYTRDPSEAIKMVDEDAGQCVFLLPPTKVSQIRGVSLAGEKMPQKSTYFYPKLITGITFNMLEK